MDIDTALDAERIARETRDKLSALLANETVLKATGLTKEQRFHLYDAFQVAGDVLYKAKAAINDHKIAEARKAVGL